MDNALHVYRANDQPATRNCITIRTDKGDVTLWSRCKRRALIRCFKCDHRRWACNMVVQVYYDGSYYRCRAGKGCAA